MSTFYPYRLACPDCGHVHTVELVEGIHITRLPEVRQQILDGKFQIFGCPACGVRTGVETSVVYTDFERNHYVAMESGAAFDWHAARLRHVRVFEDSFVHGPGIARELGRALEKRLVFGLAALREKLLLWDAGLDDVVVEGLKGDVLDDLEVEPGAQLLRLSTILEGGHLLFCRTPAPARPRRSDEAAEVVPPVEILGFETVTADEYKERAARPELVLEDYPWLSDEWFVDLQGGPAYLYR